jgi:hypothetical protein
MIIYLELFATTFYCTVFLIYRTKNIYIFPYKLTKITCTVCMMKSIYNFNFTEELANKDFGFDLLGAQ